ncbi:DUF3617 family protein [Sphingomonas sp.]|uniref:DUF3617 domain-containing protein n=1 Tax=Sphingomonas sp. TaxID=28214 RepID=UPI00286B370B|nr:DUF3617 family protein [Sphingomonas sp.]
MRTIIVGLAAAAVLAGCSDATAPQPQESEAAAALKPGEYAITAKIDDVHSTDKTTPVTKAKAGDPPTTRRACVAADGSIAAEAFADAGDKCAVSSSYVRGGRLSVQLTCSRPNGQVMQLADGDFKADSFEAKLKTATYFAGSGDYAMTRTMSGKRVGECPAASAKPATGKAKG